MARVAWIFAMVCLAGGCSDRERAATPPRELTSTTAAPPTTTTSTAVTTTSTTLPPPTTRSAPTPSTAIGNCEPGDVAVTASSDRTRYRQDELVTIVSTVKRVAARACHLPSGFTVEIKDFRGRVVTNYGVIPALSGGEPTPSFTRRYQWPQTGPDGEPVPPTVYTATASWSDFGKVYGSAKVEFAIIARGPY